MRRGPLSLNTASYQATLESRALDLTYMEYETVGVACRARSCGQARGRTMVAPPTQEALMRRTLMILVFAGAMLVPSAASAAIPTPDPEAANCHGRAMGIGASTFKGTATYARAVDLSVIDAHFAFMDLQGCHSE